MSRFVEGEDRQQPTLLPSCLDDYVGEDNPARMIDVFVGELDLGELGFDVTPAVAARPAYHPATLLKLYVFGYLNRVSSSGRLEREEGRNVELMWLTVKLPLPGWISISDVGSLLTSRRRDRDRQPLSPSRVSASANSDTLALAHRNPWEKIWPSTL